VLLGDASIDFNRYDQHAATALHYAAVVGHAGTIRLLLRKGTDSSARDVGDWHWIPGYHTGTDS
jgi:hypothetical protein